MTSLFLNAEKAHNQLLPKNYVYKELKWFRNPTYIHHTILFLTAIPMLLCIKSKFIPYIFLVWGLQMGIVQFILFHYVNKLIAEKYRFKLKKKRWFPVFPNKKFNKINNGLFHNKLISRRVLNNSKSDIKLLKKLEKEIVKNGIQPVSSYVLQPYIKKAFQVITLIFGIFIAVILDKSKDFITDSKLVLAYSFILVVGICIGIYYDRMILDILNYKYRRQQRFLRRVSRLKEFLKSK
ncbi:hypothetical protein [Flagellimonas sp. CMM7]|uniref:hypothetical protein n=1 Tax=Flagellimonas sp. CMM7 TaxID=2654676 RepID=UPI0013D466B9|nr:hypothetical protein [Flagellimonas sp. CMM7]UII78763.1 hypothetical protein LV704_13965 [Flagellimonas sp. CMM7]